MKNVNQVIEEYKVQVESSFPSIFTKVDVIQLLNSIEVELLKVPRGTSSDLLENIKDRIEDVVNEEDIEGNVELELSGNCIEVSYSTYDLIRNLTSMVEEEFEKYEVELEMEV